MNKRAFILICFIACLVSGCSIDLHGEYVIDRKGNVYRMDRRMFDLFYPQPVSVEEAVELLKIVEEMKGQLPVNGEAGQ